MKLTEKQKETKHIQDFYDIMEKSENDKENGKEINDLMKEIEDILKKMHECINREV